jgi:hypothetical protein
LKQKQTIEVKNKDIQDSINYAEKIKQALLPCTQHISQALPNSFVFYKPKDVVSGYFYWFRNISNTHLLAAVD